MTRALILTGGVGHDFGDTASCLAGILSEVGIEAEIAFDLEDGVSTWADDPAIALLVVHALRWRMLAPRYAAHRDKWAFSPSSKMRAAMRDGIAQGRPLLALHTATICFDDWVEWASILGGAWRWDRSFHPPLGPADVSIRAESHPITTGLTDFILVDEIYSQLDLVPGIVPLATAVAEGSTSGQPILWARRFGSGRVVYSGLGHDRASFEHATHRRILRRSALWSIARPDQEVLSA